jgi:hypothetical protein
MFSLQKQSAKLTSINPRAEIHGEDRVPAADLKFEIRVGNDILDVFATNLKAAVYRAAEKGEGDLLADQDGAMPVLKFPLLGPLKFGKEFVGYDAQIHYGVSGKEDIKMGDCQIDGFRFECQDGGTVIVGFRVIAHPESNDLGRLCGMIQQDVEMSLMPPEAEQ